MSGHKINHGYETRASLHKLVSRMEADGPESPVSLPALHPTHPSSGDRANDNIPSGHDDSSTKETATPATSVPGMSTPPSSIKPAASPSPSLPRSRTKTPPRHPLSGSKRPGTTISPGEFVSVVGPPFGDDARFSSVPSTGQTKKTNQVTSSKRGGQKRRSGEISSRCDDILGPFAHMLELSDRKRLRFEAYALQDACGKVCPLQMARLFWDNSTLGSPCWPQLDEGERMIKKMRQDVLDLDRIKELQSRQEAEKREKEVRRLANRRKYGLLRNKMPNKTSSQDPGKQG